MSCADVNDPGYEDDCFFCPDGIHWDAHRIGWAVAGGCAALTTLITLFTTTMHARNYQNPACQRQILRVLMMPCVYGIVSFLSYRYYREYYYYSVGETAYESITLSAFLMLLMELVAMSTPSGMIQDTLAEKDKRKFPFPFNCFRFRASKPYFWHALSFSVMQYVVIRPTLSIIGIICEYYNVLCPQQYSVHFAEVYLDAVDFVSISFALYGLIVFYLVCKDELSGKTASNETGEKRKRGWRPLSKFLAIKLIVFFTFYQSFLFDVLQDYDVIKSTSLWTATNVANGLNSLCTCVEMVFFSIYMGWAYSWKDFTNPELNPHQRQTGWNTYFEAIWDAINVSDFAEELINSTRFFIAFLRGKPGTRAGERKPRLQSVFMPYESDAAHPGAGADGKPDLYAPYPATGPAPNSYAPQYSPAPTAHARAASNGQYPDTVFMPAPESYARLAERTSTENTPQPQAQAQHGFDSWQAGIQRTGQGYGGSYGEQPKHAYEYEQEYERQRQEAARTGRAQTFEHVQPAPRAEEPYRRQTDGSYRQ